MKWRYGFLVCSAVLITVAGATVASSSETPWICCTSGNDCLASETCCSANTLGQEPCDGDTPGYCVETCKRVAGTTNFTPDRR
jgi:hypothetical protein